MSAAPLQTYYARNRTRDTDSRWYHVANRELAERALFLGIDPDQFAGIVAALSPQNAWDTPSGKRPNLDAASKFVATGANVHMSAQMAKARRILAGEDPADVLSGPKERAFFFNLARPGRTDHVTLDRWMARALDVDPSKLARQYDALADRVCRVAKRAGISPDAMQAAIWAQVRREAA